MEKSCWLKMIEEEGIERDSGRTREGGERKKWANGEMEISYLLRFRSFSPLGLSGMGWLIERKGFWGWVKNGAG